ncbi:hypothetical protein NKH18_49635 [Streptomyces sp. M10(2022)]
MGRRTPDRLGRWRNRGRRPDWRRTTQDEPSWIAATLDKASPAKTPPLDHWLRWDLVLKAVEAHTDACWVRRDPAHAPCGPTVRASRRRITGEPPWPGSPSCGPEGAGPAAEGGDQGYEGGSEPQVQLRCVQAHRVPGRLEPPCNTSPLGPSRIGDIARSALVLNRI